MDQLQSETRRVSIEFWVTSIVVTATPGTGAIFTLAAGLARGTRAGVIAAIGCILGIVPHMVLALSGAAAVFAASPVAFEVLKWLGVAYLVYMAWGTWRQTGVLAPPDEEGPAQTMGRVIVNAILVNLLNPKLTLFFFVFLPVFVDPSSSNALLRMAGLGGAFMAISLVIFVAYGVFAAWIRKYVIGKPRLMRRVGQAFALSFVVLAAMLAFTQQ